MTPASVDACAPCSGPACCLPSLPLDVFARAHSPATPRSRSPSATGGHYPRIVAANAAARDAGIRAGPARLRRRSRSRPTSCCAIATPTAEARCARSSRHVGDARSRPGVRSRRPMRCSPRSAAACGSSAACRALARSSRAARSDLGYARAARARAHAWRGAAARPRRTHGDAVLALRAAARARSRRCRSRCSISTHGRATTLAAAGVTTFGAGLRAAARRGSRAASAPISSRRLDRALRPRRPIRGRRSCRRRASRAGSTCRRRSHDVEALALRASTGWCTSSPDGSPRAGSACSRCTLDARARALRLRATRHAAPPSCRFALGAPARAPAHLLGVLRERLARVDAAGTGRGASRSRAKRRRRSPAAISACCPATRPTRRRCRSSIGCARGSARTRSSLVAPHAEHRPERASARSAPHAAPRAADTTGADARKRRLPPDALPPRPLWLLAEPAAARPPARSAAVGAARRPGAHRIRLVGRRRRAPRLLRRRQARAARPRGSIATTATASTTASGSCMESMAEGLAALRTGPMIQFSGPLAAPCHPAAPTGHPAPDRP